MARTEGINWTNQSVLRFAQGGDPVIEIERRAQELVLKARDAGWKGPPFNPIAIADLLKIRVEANSDVSDARIVADNGGLKIEFNPHQTRERLRFSIAHEVAHALFSDVADAIRYRKGKTTTPDEWQLELLCNLAAAEFVMPVGSVEQQDRVPRIEELMTQRRHYDVSAEAYLIRLAKTTNQPLMMFCASPIEGEGAPIKYRVDYSVPSRTAPVFPIVGMHVPRLSIVSSSTAIGHTGRNLEKWLSRELCIECVGIPGYPSSSYPRVAGLIRFDSADARPQPIEVMHGDVLAPAGEGVRVICQLVNDQARRWGGGVARAAGKKYPQAERKFSEWIVSIPKPERLGKVHFADVNSTTSLASLVGQAGFGQSSIPRIRYTALQEGLARVADFAIQRKATVHMPRLGTGAAGGEWLMVEEIVLNTLVAKGVPVIVYDPPPPRAAIPGLL